MSATPAKTVLSPLPSAAARHFCRWLLRKAPEDEAGELHLRTKLSASRQAVR